MRHFRLTPRAEARLAEIAGWTIDHFGPDQAASYEMLLVDRCARLASGGLPRGRSCDILLRNSKVGSGLLYARAGTHYIVYKETADLIIVLDFVHQSRNLDIVIPTLAKTAPSV